VNFTITDTATPGLAKLGGSLARSTRRMQAIGKRVEVELRAHFDRKNAQGNAKGWYRSNFWNRVVERATAFQSATGTEAVVSIASREFVHKVTGGVVRAKSGRMLAIPLRSQAKEAGSPKEWSTPGDGQLVFIKTRRGAFLFRNLGFRGGGRIKGQQLEVWYKLVASVRHLADPTALPPRADLEAAILDQVKREISNEALLQ
jgi:hypothetical protein